MRSVETLFNLNIWWADGQAGRRAREWNFWISSLVCGLWGLLVE